MQVNTILLKVSLFQYALYKVLQLKHMTSSKAWGGSCLLEWAGTMLLTGKRMQLQKQGGDWAVCPALSWKRLPTGAIWQSHESECQHGSYWWFYWEHWRPAYSDLGHRCSGPCLSGGRVIPSASTPARWTAPRQRPEGSKGIRKRECSLWHTR